MGSMTHAIGLCVPFVNDSSYIERVCELADASVGGQSSIYEVYGSFPDDLVGNLRPSETIRPMTVAQLEGQITKAHAHGIKFNYVMNSELLPIPLTERYRQDLLRFLGTLTDAGVDEVTVTVPYLIALIKRHVPQLRVNASICNEIASVREAVAFEGLGADVVVLDRDANRDFALLRQIRKRFGGDIKVLCNSACVYHCVNVHYHGVYSSALSSSSLPRPEADGTQNLTPYCTYYFGSAGLDIQPTRVVELLLGVIPTNLISPLLEGNTPQLVILGLILGGSLLTLGDKAADLNNIFGQVNDLLITVMDVVNVAAPIIPFISVFITVAQGAGAALLQGWEFVAAMYLSLTICGVIKFVRVVVKYGIKPSVLWGKLKGLCLLAFASGNISTIMKNEYELCEKGLGITPQFTSLWIPMSQAMLSPRAALNFVIPPFRILKYIDTPISAMFLVMLVIVVLELSIADPGTALGWSTLFAALGLPGEYVGLFLTYELFTMNYNAAYGALQLGLEAIESAYAFDAIDMSYLGVASMGKAAKK